MKIGKLLFVTKFEDLGYDALKSLLNLRQSGLEHIVFMYVIEREKVAMRRGFGYQNEEATRLKETANIRFSDWAERLFEQGMEVGVYASRSAASPPKSRRPCARRRPTWSSSDAPKNRAWSSFTPDPRSAN